MSQSQNLRAVLLLASALTKIHPGAGRSPGVVDLPVIRDPLGYPFVPGTMVKGSLRSKLARKAGDDSGIVECLFGPATGSAEKWAGSLTFSDLYPLFMPAPSSTHGLLYVTTPYLLAKALESAVLAGNSSLQGPLMKLVEYAKECPVLVGTSASLPRNGSVTLGAYTIKPKLQAAGDKELGSLQRELGSLNFLYQTVPLKDRILIIPEEMAIPVIGSLLLRVTRVRLNPETKTVESGGLWTEEYLPWGTLLTGLVIDNGFRGKKNECLGKDPLTEFKGKVGQVGPFVIGGKETVGAGLLKYKIIDSNM